MNHDPAEKAASDKPLIINDKQTTSGDLVIETPSDNAITVTSTGRWQHQGDVDATATGNFKGLSIDRKGVVNINGNITIHGKKYSGIFLESRAQLILGGDLIASGGTSGIELGSSALDAQVIVKGNATISGIRAEGLLLKSGSYWTSEGRLVANGTIAIAMNGGTFNHHNDLSLQGKSSGLIMTGGVATVKGSFTVQGEDGYGIRLTGGTLTLNGPLEAKSWGVGISIDNSQLAVTKAVSIQAEGEGAGIKLSDRSSATFTAPMTIKSKRSHSIDLASGSTWGSNAQLSLESPSSAAIYIKQARFEHQAPLITRGFSGVYMESGGVADMKGTRDSINEIISTGLNALNLDASTLIHQGQLKLESQGYGIKLLNGSRVVIEGTLAVTAQTQSAISLAGKSTLDLKQAITTTLNCQQATGSAVQLESGSCWSSSGVLAVTTSGERAIQLNAAHFEHQGSLALNEGQTLTIKGDLQTKGLCNVLAITNAGSAHLKVDHPLTLNNILLANTGATVILDSPQLSVHGVIDLTSTTGGSLTLNGAGTLQLDEIKCSPGSRLNINGDYQVAIGSVIFDLDNATKSPAQLAFHLSPKNQLKIGQFVLPKSSTIASAPIIEITGSDLAIDFDLKNVDIAAFPAGRHWAYQAEEKGAPIRLISDASGSLKTPASAQLTLIPAEEKMPETTTIHQLTQALSAEESSEVPGIRQRQLYYYSAAGQAAPIALLTNASSLLIPTSSQLSSSPP